MNETSCAYVLTHVPSGCFYVGSTSNPKRRLKEHLTSLKKGDHHCVKLQTLYNQAPTVKITECFITDTREDAYDLEQGLLDARCDDPNLLNVAKNARHSWLGLNHSEETKQKIGAAQKGELNHSFRKSPTQEHRDKISNANKGYKHSPEAREKIRLSKLGKTLTNEHKEKLSKIKLGSVHSEVSRAKMSANKKGRPLSDAHRNKLKEAMVLRKEKGFISYLISVNGEVYRNLSDAIKRTGLTVAILRRRLDSELPQYSEYVRLDPGSTPLRHD